MTFQEALTKLRTKYPKRPYVQLTDFDQFTTREIKTLTGKSIRRITQFLQEIEHPKIGGNYSVSWDNVKLFMDRMNKPGRPKDGETIEDISPFMD